MIKDDSVHTLRVKIWLELTEPMPRKHEWRGEIKRLETGEVTYFSRLSGFAEGVKKLGIVEDAYLRNRK